LKVQGARVIARAASAGFLDPETASGQARLIGAALVLKQLIEEGPSPIYRDLCEIHGYNPVLVARTREHHALKTAAFSIMYGQGDSAAANAMGMDLWSSAQQRDDARDFTTWPW
jgi:hypothetical protein